MYVYQRVKDGDYLSKDGYTARLAQAQQFENEDDCPGDCKPIELESVADKGCTLCGSNEHTTPKCPWAEKAASVGSKLFPDRDGTHTAIYAAEGDQLVDFLLVPKEDLGYFITKLLPNRGNAGDFVVLRRSSLTGTELAGVVALYNHAVVDNGIVLIEENNNNYPSALQLLNTD